jgi:putative flippase GtrA
MRKALLKIIDFFYPPFSKWISVDTFRYMVSGGTTLATGIIAYYVIYNLVLHQKNIHLSFVMITAPIAALVIETMITLTVGFMLNKYLIFTESNLKGRVQLFRYGSVVATNFLLNYALIKMLVEAFGFYPTIAKVVTSLLLAVFSYFSQKHFTFRVNK